MTLDERNDGLTPGSGFEGGWLAEGLSDDAVLECGVCWRVYDPTIGAPDQGAPAGTPFRNLPEHWHCPECDSEKEKFLLVQSGAAPKRGAEAQSMQARLDGLITAYRDADLAMAALPIYNPRLRIAAYGFRPYADGYVGALVTPWFLNLVVLPAQKQKTGRESGSDRAVVFPAGAFNFAAVKLDGVGAFEYCSLFSPVQQFEDQAAARIAAEAALQELFTAPPPAEEKPAPEPPVSASRRTLLFGRQRASAPAEAG